MAEIRFYIAGGPASGELLEQLGSGTFEHIGYFGPSGVGDDIIIGEAQDLTWRVNAAGVASGDGLSEDGQFSNNKWIDASGVSIASGARVALSTVQTSGEATLRVDIINGAPFDTSSARLYAYDGTDVNNDPTGLWVLSYEIIPASVSGLGDTEWALIDATNFNECVDRNAGVGYSKQDVHSFWFGLSMRPKLTASSGLQTFALRFEADISV